MRLSKYNVDETMDFFALVMGFWYGSLGAIRLVSHIWWAGIPAHGAGP